MEASEKPTKKSPLKLILIAVIVVAIALAAYFFLQYQKAQQQLKNPTAAAKEEVHSLVAKVGQLMELPKGEDPTVATVSDKTKLASQPFFANAENGDKVLIYTQAKKAILYRPSENKIINVAPIDLGAAQPTTAQPVRVALYNGTSIVGYTTTIEKQLTSALPNVTVVKKDNASGTYSKTEVVDLTGKLPDVAKKIADSLSGSVVSSVPVGETKPDADILVLLGK